MLSNQYFKMYQRRDCYDGDCQDKLMTRCPLCKRYTCTYHAGQITNGVVHCAPCKDMIYYNNRMSIMFIFCVIFVFYLINRYIVPLS